MDRRTLLTALSALLLAVLLGQLNHYLTPWHVQVWAGGLFVTFAALRLDFRPGAAGVFIAGLLLDAHSPVVFGTHALLFLAAHAVITNVRARLPREETIIGVFVALIANLGLFLALSFLRIDDSPAPADTWLRLFADLIASQILVALIGPWFFALQERLLFLAGINVRAEHRGQLS